MKYIRSRADRKTRRCRKIHDQGGGGSTLHAVGWGQWVLVHPPCVTSHVVKLGGKVTPGEAC